MSAMNVFVPVTEELMDRLGLTPEDLVPFDLDYRILRPGEEFQEDCVDLGGESLS